MKNHALNSALSCGFKCFCFLALAVGYLYLGIYGWQSILKGLDFTPQSEVITVSTILTHVVLPLFAVTASNLRKGILYW